MGALTGDKTPSAEDVAWFHIDEPSTVGAARRAATTLASRLGLSDARAAEVGIAVTEVATNLVKHARDGTLLLRAVRWSGVGAVEFVACDHGPGVANLVLSGRDGQSTTGTLGIGLGAIARLSSSYDAHSVPGLGTVLAATFWGRDHPAAPLVDTAGVTRPMTGETVCGDAYAVRQTANGVLGLLCDGLGHGPLAGAAAAEAVRLFLHTPPAGPAEMLRHLHAGLRATRGLAAGIVEMDIAARVTRFAGLGNVTAALVRDQSRRGMMTHAGIVGHGARRIAEFDYELAPRTLVVLHTDGMTDKWDFGRYRALADHGALVIAATLFRDAAVRRDDAAVLVAKGP